MKRVWLTLLLVLVVVKGEEQSAWSTLGHDLQRTSFSNLVPYDVFSAGSKLWSQNALISPIFIVGNSLTFGLLTVNISVGAVPVGRTLQAFDPSTGTVLWDSGPSQEFSTQYAAFAPSYVPNTGIVACSVQYSAQFALQPSLHCWNEGGSKLFEKNVLSPSNQGNDIFYNLEFITPQLLFITDYGNELQDPGTFILINIANTSPEVVWNVTGLFAPEYPPSVRSRFMPSFLSKQNQNYLFVSTYANNQYYVTAFNYSFTQPSASRLWTYATNATNEYQIGKLMISESQNLILFGLTNYNGLTNYIIGLNISTGLEVPEAKLPFPTEPLIGYAHHPGKNILYVVTNRTILSFNMSVSPFKLIDIVPSPHNFYHPLSAPTLDSMGNIYVCDNGNILRYSSSSNQVTTVVDTNSQNEGCDQPIILNQGIIVRTGITAVNPGLFYAGVQIPVPQPEGIPVGGVVGIVFGVLIVVSILVITIIRSRSNKGYQIVN